MIYENYDCTAVRAVGRRLPMCSAMPRGPAAEREEAVRAQGAGSTREDAASSLSVGSGRSESIEDTADRVSTERRAPGTTEYLPLVPATGTYLQQSSRHCNGVCSRRTTKSKTGKHLAQGPSENHQSRLLVKRHRLVLPRN